MVKYLDVVIVGLLLFLSIGFNVFSIDNNNTDVGKGIYYDNFTHTDNVKINNVDGTNLDFSGELSMPGDYYEIKFDVINSTSTDVSISECFYNENDNYISYKLTYSNGDIINEGDILKKGETKGIIYKVSYMNPVLENDYTFDSSFNIRYEQVL